MGSVGAFFAVLLFGFLGFCIGTAVDAAEAGGIVFAIAAAVACIVDAVERAAGRKNAKN